jgi:hypothetical protein
MRKPSRRPALLAAGALVVGLVACSTRAPAPAPAVAAIPDAAPTNTGVGASASFSARLLPKELKKQARHGRIDVAVQLESMARDFNRSRFFVLLYRADGEIIDDQRPSTFDLIDGRAEQTISWPELPDGLYRGRVIAVATNGSGYDTSDTELYFEVKGGDLLPSNLNDWNERSGSMAPHLAPPPGTPDAGPRPVTAEDVIRAMRKDP